MVALAKHVERIAVRATGIISGLATVLVMLAPSQAFALPAFARQTGQNCVACHAGGQFPELTPYGRMFKMTGYTIGERSVPLSVMGVLSYAKVNDTSKTDDPTVDFQKNGAPMFATGSVFLAGKVTDNIGAFIQNTYDNYASQSAEGRFKGHSQADNMDIRYADHFIDTDRDLALGLSINNNPTVSDPWSSAAAWMQYVPGASPTSHQFADGPYPGYGAGSNLAGASVYGYWNKIIYAELGTYRTANRAFSFMSAGIPNGGTTHLEGNNNPYWRFAYSREWGPHNLMIGTSGMNAHVYDDPTDTSIPDSVSHIKNTGIDAQYQYLLDTHTITAQMAYMRQTTNYSVASGNPTAPSFTDSLGNSYNFVDASGNPLPLTNSSDTTNIFRAKVSYIYQAKYGGSLAFFNVTGTTNTANQTSGYDPCSLTVNSTADTTVGCAPSTRVGGNFSGNPATRGFTYEAFWTPVQYVRVGAQYTTYSKFNGATDNYDGFGRNAKDNNTLRLYVWAAY
jgi:hypothetical protein